MMRRVVVTGVGLVSCLGNDQESVTSSLREGKSGISFNEDFQAMGLRSQISGSVEIDLESHIDRKHLRFMGDAAAYAYVSLQDAIADAGLEQSQVSNYRTGLIAGSGGASSSNIVLAADKLRERGVKRLGPYVVPKTMSSTISACLSTHFGIRGLNYSVTSACATSTHCIGTAMEQIQWGKQDVIFAGGGEENHWSLAMMFDAMGALSTHSNDSPATASRAYDVARDGFVISGGGGMLVLEELEHAKARGAKIYAELAGYGATSDGDNMVAPSGEGAVRCMQQALSQVDTPVDYINTHGTSTPLGDIAELDAMREVFGDAVPLFSSSKSLCGHSLGAAGVQEAIHCLLMMKNRFVAGSANITDLDPRAEGMPVLLESRDHELNTVMSNNFGFGGTNACVIFRRYTSG
jgi:3-oxoacyl-[acyl-carrier-protein] synthase-1